MTRTILLGDIAEIQTGPFGSQLHQEDYVQQGTPIVTVEHLGQDRMTTQNLPRVSDNDAKRLSKYTLAEGDTVFSRVGSVDRASYVHREEDGWMFSGRCLRVRPDSTKVNPRFLSFQLRSPAFTSYIKSIAVGATMPSINTKLLATAPVKLPERNEQDEIAEILDAIEAKIELNRKMNETLERIGQALFRHYFIDNPEEDKRENKTIGELCNVKIGRTPPRKESEWFSNDIGEVWVSIKDMGQSSTFISNSSEYLTQEAVEKFRIPAIEPNTILLSFKLTVGRLCVSTKRMYSNEAIAQLPLNGDEISTEYLYYFLRNFNYQSLSSTSSIATAVNSSTVKNIRVSVPNEKTLRSFTEQVRDGFEAIKSNEEQIQTLTILRDTLLPRLIDGKIKV